MRRLFEPEQDPSAALAELAQQGIELLQSDQVFQLLLHLESTTWSRGRIDSRIHRSKAAKVTAFRGC